MNKLTADETSLYQNPGSVEKFVLSVIIPVYNEIRTIDLILKRVLAVPLDVEVIVVDDASSDGTSELLQEKYGSTEPRVRLLTHQKNSGKGAAIRTGIGLASGDFVIIQDADLEYDPREYATLLEPLVDGRADVVFGSRFLGGGPHRVCFFWHRVANGMLTNYSNVMTNLNLTDMEACYKVFRREVIQSISIRSNGFDFEPEVTAKVAKLNCRIYEVPISYSGRDYSEGKKIGLKDAFAAAWAITRYRFID